MSDKLADFNRISSRQHGPVTRAQALKAGLTARQLRTQSENGRLRVPYRGIYVPASVPPSFACEVMAACLYTGGHASRACAAFLWQLRGFESAPVEVTVPYAHTHHPTGLLVHRSRNIDARDVCTKDNIPITTVAATLVDITASHPELAEGALNDAIVRARTRRYRIENTLARAGTRGCAGAVLLRKLLAELDVPTESALEDAFRDFIRRFGLPEPKRQVPIGGGRYRLDFGWPEIKYSVETDGGAFHSSPADRRRDRAKAAQARSEGWTVRRVYWHDVNEGAEGLAADLKEELELRCLREVPRAA